MMDDDKTARHERAALAQTAPMDPSALDQDLALARTMEAPAPPGGVASIRRAGPAERQEARVTLGPGVILHEQFELRSELGQGGMGAVWMAYDRSLDRQVAIKVLSDALADDPDLKARFIREARAQARLNHPHVVPIYYIGDQGGLLFFVMERVRGESLQARLDRGERTEWADAIRLMIALSSALKQAQARGIIHRDIKPGNILLDEDGHVKLADFGLAKPIQEDADQALTAGHAFLGTPLYMPPEQGRAEQVDHRADMYALGATFYHLLTGQPPYQGKSALAVMLKHASEPTPDARALEPHLPGRLSALLTRLMAKTPEQRFQSYDELLQALHEASPRALRPVGLTTRLGAALIDLVIASLGVWGLLTLLGPEHEHVARMIYPLYMITMMALHRRTLGMWLLNLELRDERGERPSTSRAMARLVAQVWALWPILGAGLIVWALYGAHDPQDAQALNQGGAPLGILVYVIFIAVMLTLQLLSVWMIALHPHKRALHDLMTRTYIVYRD